MADRFRFRRNASIGAAAAEEDDRFLAQCFVDTGDLATLMDCADPRRIILGRTGIGKSALLSRVATHKNAILISPESLSFNYLANSLILQFFAEAGVKLDLFFKLLWRHVFTVELLKTRYGITNEATKLTFLDRIREKVARNKKKERAIKYLLQWGDKFWEPTEYRIKEITSRIEKDLEAKAGLKTPMLELGASGAAKLTREEKAEIVQRGQAVINEIQIRELTDVVEFLNEDIFDDPQRHYYVVIDKLDENWIDDRFRYLLIRSLIETVRDFQKVKNIKILVVLRTDLIERVFRFTRDPGFQEEKYRSLFLQLRWTAEQLTTLLDARVSYLVKQTYTKEPAVAADLLTSKIDGENALSYMLRRTLMRPRELIEFFNECIERSEGKPTISRAAMLDAEGTYSKLRLRSLQDEWVADYPSLLDFASLLQKRPSKFGLPDIGDDVVEGFCLNYSIDHPERVDQLSVTARQAAEGALPIRAFLATLFHVFYRTGIVGLKTATSERIQWSYVGTESIPADTIDTTTRVEVHPTFWRVLGIHPRT